MKPVLVRYHFSQHFSSPAKKAFDWCTSFDSEDPKLMGGEENSSRQVIPIAETTLILRDTFHLPTGTVEKQKLVQLYPEQLTWVSTHLSGPNRHSQFLYVISPKGRGASVLDFYANHLEYTENADARLLAKQLCKEDAALWKLLAKAMAKELS
ncbi:MAG: hypothetical protein NWE95_10270 [Candidatus Bathyarchaeota archaeon]|nr:hypothetical protein [Candidatus Bathyarchaeota archaeon]